MTFVTTWVHPLFVCEVRVAHLFNFLCFVCVVLWLAYQRCQCLRIVSCVSTLPVSLYCPFLMILSALSSVVKLTFIYDKGAKKYKKSKMPHKTNSKACHYHLRLIAIVRSMTSNRIRQSTSYFPLVQRMHNSCQY